MFKELSHWYMDKMEEGGYALIAALMAVESSIVPLPSEVIIPPAAHLAYTGRSHLSIAGIIIAGTAGSWIGASVMYWASRLAGRPLVKKYGKVALVSEAKLEGAERWASHYGAAGIFVSRLLPVVRHLIGIPAGIVRMDYRLFSLFTILGSAVWCAVLCYVGVKMGQDEKLMQGQLRQVTLWLAGFMICLGAMYYFFVHRQMRRK
jgi:membrane protein DedA with SNARE-associated domain